MQRHRAMDVSRYGAVGESSVMCQKDPRFLNALEWQGVHCVLLAVCRSLLTGNVTRCPWLYLVVYLTAPNQFPLEGIENEEVGA